MTDNLTRWQGERVEGQAESVAAELAAEHYLRWRLAHLRPDDIAVQRVAARWPDVPGRAAEEPEPGITLSPWHRRPRPDLAELQELRYRDPARFARARDGVDGIAAAHLLLLSGAEDRARAEYLRLITSEGTIEAWIGLALTRRRLSGHPWTFPIRSRPEVAVAVHERIQATTKPPAASGALVEWLARDWLD
jgi:hypothetical protein